MTTEYKQLLIQDLCARLPYGVKGRCEINVPYDTFFDTIFKIHKFNTILNGIKGSLLFVTPLIKDINNQEFANKCVANGIGIIAFKPYLRPISSMTEEEKVEYCDLQDKFLLSSQYPVTAGYALYDWLNKKMFDFRDLIPKGLAIEVTEENNPYKD